MERKLLKGSHGKEIMERECGQPLLTKFSWPITGRRSFIEAYMGTMDVLYLHNGIKINLRHYNTVGLH